MSSGATNVHAQNLVPTRDLVKQRLEELLGDDWRRSWVASVRDQGDKGSWFGGYAGDLVPLMCEEDNIYVCVSLMDGRRNTQNVIETRLFALDDLGTKGDLGAALGLLGVPTQLVETSPGNYTGIWVYDEGVKDGRVHVALMRRAIELGLGDDLADTSRYMRVGAGVNNKPKVIAANGGAAWGVRMDVQGRFDVGRRVSVGFLAGVLGVDLSEDALLEVSMQTSVDKGTAFLADPDPWLEAMMDLDWVLGSGSGPGKVDIRCPWHEEHSVRPDSGTAYLGRGLFQCHHGSCAERHSPAFQAKLIECIEEDKAGLVSGPGWLAGRVFSKSPLDPETLRVSREKAWDREKVRQAVVAADVFDSWVYCVQTETFVNLQTCASLNAEQFCVTMIGRFGVYGGKPFEAANKLFLNDPRGRKVAMMTYYPGQGPITMMASPSGVPVSAVNLWRPTYGFEPELGVGEDDVRPWLEHLEYLYPDLEARKYALWWMAWNAQKPGEKIQWAMVLGGVQGTGKDTLFKPLWQLIGDRNTREVSPAELRDKFNDWAQAQVVILAELARNERFDLVNDLKTYIATGARPTLMVNPKFGKKYSVPNNANYLVMTNKEDALAIDDTDRRFFVYWSPAEPLGADYYEGLMHWYEKEGGYEKVAGYLLGVDVSGIRPDARPPVTVSKKAMIHASLSVAAQWVVSELQDDGGLFQGRGLVTIKELVDAGRRARVGGLTEHVAVEALRAAGAARVRGGAKIRLGANRGVVRLWALERVSLYDQMTPDQLRDAFDRDALKGAAVFPPVP